jgi:ADP-ribose pyrophosphatase
MTLFYPPEIKIEVVEQETIPQEGFLKILRSKVIAHYPDDTKSKIFTIDSVLRDRLDAVVIVAHYVSDQQMGVGEGTRYVYLRSALRPSLMLRSYETSGLLEDEYVGNLYELPAGLVELNEVGLEGLKQAAAREMEEELGFTMSPDKFKFLGHRIFPAVGIAAERIFFLEIEVDPTQQKIPTLDGSPMEDGAIIKAVPLTTAVEYARKGYLPDAKTEIGILRLADKFLPKVISQY